MIKHILSDGTELKSIEGRIVPPEGKTEVVYRLMAEFSKNRRPDIETRAKTTAQA